MTPAPLDDALFTAIVDACVRRGGDELGEVAESWLLMPLVPGEPLNRRMSRLAELTRRPPREVAQDVRQVRGVARRVTVDLFARSELVG